MATIELTAENFESTMTGGGLVLIDFWAAPRAFPDTLRPRMPWGRMTHASGTFDPDGSDTPVGIFRA